MGSKQKSKEYSHLGQIIPMLNIWWGETFKKVPASGALRWGGAGGHWVYGDLVPPESFPFLVEAKFHQAFDLDEIIRKKLDQGKITYYWLWQAVADANRASQELGTFVYPLLIYKANNKGNRIILQKSLWDRIPQEARNEMIHLTPYIPGVSPFVITDLVVFLKKVPRSVVERDLLCRRFD